jgi:hypothetical protein
MCRRNAGRVGHQPASVKRSLCACVVAAVFAVAVGGCSSAPSTSFKDGFYWANDHGAPGNGDFIPGGMSNAEVCSERAALNVPTGDDVGQWEAGCVSAAQGHTLP